MVLKLKISALLVLLTTSLHAGLFEHFTVQHGLHTNQIYGVAQDAQGRIWFSGNNSMCVFEGFSFSCYSIPLSTQGDKVVGVFKGPNKALYCYSLFGNFFRFNNQTFEPVPISQAGLDLLKSGLVNNVVCDDEGYVYISTMFNGDLITVEPISGETDIIEMPAKNHKYYIFEIADHAFITLNTAQAKQNKVLFHGAGINTSFSLSGGAGFSKSIVTQLRDGSMLYSKDFELVHFDKDGVKARIFLEKSIECFLQDINNNLWVGLNGGGLIKFAESRVASTARTNYILNKSVTGLFQDNTGDLWVTTSSHGIYLLPSQSPIAYVPPKIFSAVGDSQNIEVSTPENVTYEASNDPHKSQSVFAEQVSPSVYISGVSILNQDTTVLSNYNLAYDKNFIRISFAGISPIHPELLQFRYKLDGVNEDWVYTSNHEVQYTTLPPGKYFFEVNAMNTNGVWSEKPATISFNINAPYWKTWWFITICTILGIGITIVVIYYSQLQIREKERKKAEINKKIAELELQALRAQMNPHFIFNTISSIQYFVTANESDSALRYLTKFAKLMRSIMENSKQPRIPIKSEMSAIELYLDLEKLRFEDKFDYSLEVSDEIETEFALIPPLLIQPYLENALNHGILNKEDQGHIRVEIKKDNDFLIASIIDNGIGRQAAQKIKSSKIHTHKSRGMSITKNRLEILNKMDNSEMNVEIEDLFTDQGTAAGTKVIIYIPLKTEKYENQSIDY